MNKLLGFYELKALDLPSIPWQEYTGDEILSEQLLWTIRSAVFQGADLNLPRLVGVPAAEAACFAKQLLNQLKKSGIVICYPYFRANKSGTLSIEKERSVIEAVSEDLWNLVTYSKRNVSIIMTDQRTVFDGDAFFLTKEEKKEIISYIPKLKRRFRDELIEGKNLLLEWSFANNCNLMKERSGKEYLIFYELRIV